MRIPLLAGLLLVSLCVAAMTTGGAVVNEFKAQEQQVLTVTGRVVSIGEMGGACYLYFGRDPKRCLVAVIPAGHRSRFPVRPESRYRNQRVQVSGTVRENQGRLEIVLNRPDQITIVRPGTSPSSATPERKTLRLETRMARLEAEMKALKQQVARADKAAPTVQNRPDLVQRALQVELKTLYQQVAKLTRQVKDLEDIVDHLGRTHVLERRGGR